jgi:hypothetical protein
MTLPHDDDEPYPWPLRLAVWVALIALSMSGWVAVLWAVM